MDTRSGGLAFAEQAPSSFVTDVVVNESESEIKPELYTRRLRKRSLKDLGKRMKGYSDLEGLKAKILSNKKKHGVKFMNVVNKFEAGILKEESGKLQKKASRISNKQIQEKIGDI